ncbi:MAG: hypothetical protein IKA10_07120 [Oscillospiraceae bacterium]|nr:hypothetical protein [Oscillospiraceae bacterium]
MKKSKMKIFLDSKYFTMLLSFLMAVAIWIVVVTFFSTDARTTIREVPIDIAYNSSYLNLDLEIIEQSIETVDVTVVGPRDVVGSLTKDDIIVYPSVNNVKMAGRYDLSLNAVKKSAIKEYQIESLSNYQVAVRFDHLAEKSFKIDVDISNLIIPEDLMVDKVTITPDKVTVKGPENTVSKIAKVVAAVEQQELSQTTVLPATLVLYDENDVELDATHISYDVEEFNVTVPVLKEITVPVVIDYTNVPSGFDVSTLKVALSQQEITLAVPSRSADSVNQFVAGYIDLSTLELDKAYVFDIKLPSGYKNVKEVEEISATVLPENLESKSVTVKEIKLINAGEQKVEVLTEIINHVEIVGDKKVVEELTDDSVIAQLDMTQVALAQGQQTVEVEMIIPSTDAAFVRGTYYVTIKN